MLPMVLVVREGNVVPLALTVLLTEICVSEALLNTVVKVIYNVLTYCTCRHVGESDRVFI